MKRVKLKETNICEYCRNQGIKRKAEWKDSGRYVCSEHKEKLNLDNGYMTEADYQTWYRL
jgi:hypothetical protein